MSDELTVEDARTELREFPDMEIQLTVRARTAGWRVWLGLRGGNFYGSTLSDCMAQIRAWKHSQEQER